MPNQLREKILTFDFPTHWRLSKYDEWHFYVNSFSDCCGGNKAVDFLAIDTSTPSSHILWLIEVKDYRQFPRTKEIYLWDEIALKARDTLAGLFAASMDGSHRDQPFAKQCLTCQIVRIVLHLEQHKTGSKLFPRPYSPANVQQKLKQLVKAIDAHPKVTEMQKMGNVAWTVQ